MLRRLVTPKSATSVTEWRRRCLIAAGFDAELSSQLAEECRIDLHELVTLVERGCPPHLAARILAPLPDERRRC